MRDGVQSIIRAFSELPWLIIAGTSPCRVVLGVEIRVSAPTDEVEVVFGQASAALQLIDRFDYDTICTMRRDVRCILFTAAHGGHYFRWSRICRVSHDYAKRSSALDLAMVIVHEATHARLEALGVGYNAATKEAIERRCIEAEVAFARRVPDSSPAISRAMALFERQWWRPDQEREDVFRELVERGIPEFLIRWIVRLQR
jgi:hypothetical protein